MMCIQSNNNTIPDRLFKQSQPLRIESSEFPCLITSRCINSRLWLVNLSQNFLDRILGFLAKYSSKYDVKLYSFVIFGNHYHLLAQFKKPNRAQFMRDFNARISEGARMFLKGFEGGPLFERRFSCEIVPLQSDLEDRFAYCTNQSVRAGISKDPNKCVSYNSFLYAMNGISKEYRVVNWSKYKSAKRSNPNVSIEKYTQYFELKYMRLLGHEEATKTDYQEFIKQLINLDIQKIINEKDRLEKGFIKKGKFKKPKIGSRPKNTKKSSINSKRPLVLTRCSITKKKILEWYFSIYYKFKEACAKYINGISDVEFPKGTYRPQAFKTVEDSLGCFI